MVSSRRGRRRLCEGGELLKGRHQYDRHDHHLGWARDRPTDALGKDHDHCWSLVLARGVGQKIARVAAARIGTWARRVLGPVLLRRSRPYMAGGGVCGVTASWARGGCRVQKADFEAVRKGRDVGL